MSEDIREVLWKLVNEWAVDHYGEKPTLILLGYEEWMKLRAIAEHEGGLHVNYNTERDLWEGIEVIRACRNNLVRIYGDSPHA